MIRKVYATDLSEEMLAIARAGRLSEAEAYRKRYVDLIVSEEATYGSLESRMKEFAEDNDLYRQAKRMAEEGTLTRESTWYQDNLKSIVIYEKDTSGFAWRRIAMNVGEREISD